MDQVIKEGAKVTVIREGVKVQKTYSSPEDARRATRRLEKSQAARDRWMTRKSR
jgi:hypothetical protein